MNARPQFGTIAKTYLKSKTLPTEPAYDKMGRFIITKQQTMKTQEETIETHGDMNKIKWFEIV